MYIQVKFKKNDSPKFEEILKNSRKFKIFSQNGAEYTIAVDKAELKKRKKTLRGIISRIRDWPEAEFYLNNKKVSSHELDQIIEVLLCEEQNKALPASRRSCQKGEGWGCDKLNSVFYNSAENHPNSPKNWYNYGKFDKGDWLIDKKEIKKILLDEAERKHIDNCSLFNEEEIDRVLETIPTRINPDHDPNWEYRYKTSKSGGFVKEIDGIKPRKNTANQNSFNDFQNLFSSNNPLFNIFDALTDDQANSGSFFGWDGAADNSGGIFSDLFGTSGSSSSNFSRFIPDTTFEDIGGLDEIVRQVKEVIEFPIVAPELLNYYNIKPHKGILLYGPPGCGKTLLAKAVANEINAHFISISGPEILNKYVGQSEENLRSIFKEALQKAPSIIYFDEFDSIAANRNQEFDPHNAKVVNQILTLLDGLEDNSKICVIASTNRIDIIDAAVKRPGRFDYVLEVTKPTPDGCKQIFNIYTQSMPVEDGFDREEFVEKNLLESTGAEIAFVATEAAYNSIRRTVDIDSVLKGQKASFTEENKITEKDFLKAIETLEKNRKNSTVSGRK